MSVTTIKRLRELLGFDLRTAKQYVESVPCVIISDIEMSKAEYISEELQSIGANTNVINEEVEIITPTPVPVVTDIQRSNEINNFQLNDRELMFKTWSEYSERDFK